MDIWRRGAGEVDKVVTTGSSMKGLQIAIKLFELHAEGTVESVRILSS